MPSFDIVSEIDAVELRNAVDNASREVSTRFDFNGVQAEIRLNDMSVELCSESDFQVKQLHDLFINHCVKRSVSTLGIDSDSELVHSGRSYSQTLIFKQGIEQPKAKEIVRLLKDSKLKVQASIQGEKIRVSGKKRDDLQACIAFLKKSDVEIPLQFENFRD